jgi:uncharacterized protein
LLLPKADHEIKNGAALTVRKILHVSPFNQVEGQYQFRFYSSNERWLARIDYQTTAGRLLHTHLSGEHQALTRSSLRRLSFALLLQSIGVITRIHWQALRIYLKGVPFIGKRISKDTGISKT